MRNFSTELFGYGLASAAALAIDLSVLEALVQWAGWNYLPASAVAFIAGTFVAYVLSVRFVFGFRQVGNASVEFGWFLGLGAVGLLVNAGALFIAVSAIKVSLVLGKLFAAGCTFGTNFALRRQLLFTPARSA